MLRKFRITHVLTEERKQQREKEKDRAEKEEQRKREMTELNINMNMSEYTKVRSLLSLNILKGHSR